MIWAGFDVGTPVGWALFEINVSHLKTKASAFGTNHSNNRQNLEYVPLDV